MCSSIYVGPKSGEDKSVPLVVFPHGGPHSVVTTRFIRDAFFFNLLGYAVLFVNYRGSTGRGQESVDSLLGIRDY